MRARRGAFLLLMRRLARGYIQADPLLAPGGDRNDSLHFESVVRTRRITAG
jgi:hypothetical protein